MSRRAWRRSSRSSAASRRGRWRRRWPLAASADDGGRGAGAQVPRLLLPPQIRRSLLRLGGALRAAHRLRLEPPRRLPRQGRHVRAHAGRRPLNEAGGRRPPLRRHLRLRVRLLLRVRQLHGRRHGLRLDGALRGAVGRRRSQLPPPPCAARTAARRSRRSCSTAPRQTPCLTRTPSQYCSRRGKRRGTSSAPRAPSARWSSESGGTPATCLRTAPSSPAIYLDELPQVGEEAPVAAEVKTEASHRSHKGLGTHSLTVFLNVAMVFVIMSLKKWRLAHQQTLFEALFLSKHHFRTEKIFSCIQMVLSVHSNIQG